jgi:hypothetical protein
MNTMAAARPAPALAGPVPALPSPALPSPALPSPAGPQACRVRLTPGPVAAAQARRQVEAAIAAWGVMVDADVAVLLTSDLVTHAIRHAPGGAVTLSVRCTRAHLRVDVHDSARPQPTSAGVQPGVAAGAGLALVASLSADWGCYQTPAGQAVYFTLEPDVCPTA